MEEKTTPEERNMDRRLVERNLRKGIVSQADIDAYEGKLKDVSANLEVVTIDGDEEEAPAKKVSEAKTAATAKATNAGNDLASVSNLASSQGGA